MENYIKFDGRSLIRYSVDGNTGSIKYSDIKPYYSYATKNDVEGIHASISGKYIVFSLLVAEGQGGIVGVWDTVANKLVHVSEGSYVIASTVSDNKVYMLCEVINFNYPINYLVTEIRFGVMDANKEAELVADHLEIVITTDDDYHISIIEGDIIITVNGTNFIVNKKN